MYCRVVAAEEESLEAVRRVAELAIRTGEKLQEIADAALEVAKDDRLPASPTIDRLRTKLRAAGLLREAITSDAQSHKGGTSRRRRRY